MKGYKYQFQRGIIIALLLILALISAGHAERVTVSVGTNTTTWTISRESESLKFEYSQYVEGSISPVEYRGRALSPTTPAMKRWRSMTSACERGPLPRRAAMPQRSS